MKLALLLLCAGCFAQATGGTTIARGGVTGGAAELAVGAPAGRVVLRAVVQQDTYDLGPHLTAFHLDEGVRGSLLGAIYGDRDPDWINWVDLGADAGVGVGIHGLDAFASAYAGAFADVRVWPLHDDYPTLHVEIRRAAYTEGVANETELFVGVGWTGRNPGNGPTFLRFD